MAESLLTAAFDIRRVRTAFESCPCPELTVDDELLLPDELDLGGVGNCLRGAWFVEVEGGELDVFVRGGEDPAATPGERSKEGGTMWPTGIEGILLKTSILDRDAVAGSGRTAVERLVVTELSELAEMGDSISSSSSSSSSESAWRSVFEVIERS